LDCLELMHFAPVGFGRAGVLLGGNPGVAGDHARLPGDDFVFPPNDIPAIRVDFCWLGKEALRDFFVQSRVRQSSRFKDLLLAHCFSKHCSISSVRWIASDYVGDKRVSLILYVAFVVFFTVE
jgi:hypothetical protein